MPAAIDLVIADGTSPTAVNRTFTLYQPAAGLGGIAEWAYKTGAVSSGFPRLTLSAKNSPNKGRNVTIKFRMPSTYTDPVTGQTAVGPAFEYNGTISVPNDFPEALKNDAVAFMTNINAHAMVKACARDGLPAT